MIHARRILSLGLCIASSSLAAQTILVSCPKFFDKDKSQKVTCVEALFSQDKYHFTLASLPPSNGFAPGVVFEHRRHIVSAAAPGQQAKKSLLDLSATLAASTNSSWIVAGDLRWLLPRGYRQPDGEKAENGYLWLENHPEAMTFHASGAHRSVRTLYYFGEGSRSPAQQYMFGEDDTYGSLQLRYPVNKNFALTGETGASATVLPAQTDSAAVAAHIPATSLPGLSAQPILVHNSVAVTTSFAPRLSHEFEELPLQDDPHLQPILLFRLDNQVSFRWEQPADSSPYAFQQFVFSGTEAIQIHAINRNTFSAKKHPLLNHICENNKKSQECAFGDLKVHALLALSHTSGNNQLPFYLEPTLGGTDMESRVTLRGWDNYRFRGRDAALLQLEYGVPVYDPFGVYVFYDAGKVGASPSDLSPLDFRQDAGLGLSVRVRGHVIAQTYLAWGAGHGTRWNYNFSKSF